VLVLLSPISFLSLLGWWAIPGIGIYTLFYVVIFRLSMMFLDPVDNDKDHENLDHTVGFDIGVLLREVKAFVLMDVPQQFLIMIIPQWRLQSYE